MRSLAKNSIAILILAFVSATALATLDSVMNPQTENLDMIGMSDSDLTTLNALYLKLSGGTLTGALTLSTDCLESLSSMLYLQSSVSATAILDRFSPAQNFIGYGWDTDGAGSSKAFSLAQLVTPESGADPVGVFRFCYGTNTTTPSLANEIMRFEWGGRSGTTITGTLGAGVGTLSGNNANAAFTLLNLNNTDTPSTTETGQTSDLVFNLTQSINSVVSLHEAAKISAYKVSDWFHATTEADTDSGLKFWTTNSGTPTLQLTIDEAGLATFVGNIVVPTEYIGSTPNTGMVHPLQISGNLSSPRSSIVRRDIGTTIPNYTGVWNVNTVDTNTVGYIDVTATGATKGGMQITGFTGSDTTATTVPLLMGGVIGTASPGATQPTMVFRGGKWNGTTGINSIANAEVLAVWRNWASDVLTIYGNGNITTAGTGAFGGFQLGTSTTAGYVLTADASGVGTWQAAGGGAQTPWTSNIDADGYDLNDTGTGTFGSTYQAVLGNDASGEAGYLTDGNRTVTLVSPYFAISAFATSASYAGEFGDGAGNYVYLADQTYAINATGYVQLESCLLALNGGYVQIGSDGSGGTGGQSFFGDGTGRTVTLLSGSYALEVAQGAGYFNLGSYTADLCSFAGGYFYDTANSATLADGTYAINASGPSYFEVGGTDTAIEAYQNNNAGGAAGYFHSIAGSVYLADVSNNYAINATGDVYISGKVTSTGGYDPPYVLYDPQTREQITTRVADEIPEEKLGGAVLFFNKDTQQLEVKIGERYFKITMEEVWQ